MREILGAIQFYILQPYAIILFPKRADVSYRCVSVLCEISASKFHFADRSLVVTVPSSRMPCDLNLSLSLPSILSRFLNSPTRTHLSPFRKIEHCQSGGLPRTEYVKRAAQCRFSSLVAKEDCCHSWKKLLLYTRTFIVSRIATTSFG